MYKNQNFMYREQGGFFEPSGGYLPPNYTGAPYPPQAPQGQGTAMPTMQQPQQMPTQKPTTNVPPQNITSVQSPQTTYGPYGVTGPRQEESYIENILRVNVGRLCRIYMTYDGSKSWTDKTYEGILEAAGRDHIILKDSQSERRYLLLMIYLDYVEFFEKINYYYFVNNYYIANFTEKDLDPAFKQAIIPLIPTTPSQENVQR